MTSTNRKTSRRVALVTSTVTVALAVGLGAATPAVAAPAAPHAPLESAQADESLPPLDPELFRKAIGGLPDDEVTGALVQVRGSAGEWEGTSGVGNIHTGRPVPQNARFRIGSVTKTFTATAVLRLAGQGKIDLDRPVQDYLPGVLPADYPPVPLRTLLNHTNGLPGLEIPHKDPTWFLAHRFDTWTPDQLVRGATQGVPIRFAPGTKQEYGNVGLHVAGMLIEKVTGRPYADAIRNGIIRPLHLTNTFLPGADVRIPGPVSRGYEAMDIGGHTVYVDVTEANPTLQWSASEMISNAPDLDRFAVALLGGRLTKPEQTAELFTVPDVPMYDGDDDPSNDQPAVYSVGITRYHVGPYEFWGKTGDRPGFACAFGATRDLARRVVFSANKIHMAADQPAIAERIIAASAGIG
ncbi:MAG: serine hydrolase [Actinophytocola sp.]|uniref:serine hydrolase domain-containing protein n=1 Tax=Actinophytocola sp. TaxID=1872138 RepID=UPI0013245F75|nr:serine hydrolase domain-containing protein [Actinophytocola sp.]MPZ81239.1 serine hydrolase [Actinophytocola sp.]